MNRAHLKFFGNGSGFTNSHTNAYFEFNNNLVLIDLSMLNLYKALELKPQNYNNIFLFVTHMHDDHTSGIGLFIQHMYYLHKRKIIIIAPPSLQISLKEDLRIKGIDGNIFSIINIDDANKIYKIKSFEIPTTHAPELSGECFGYIFYMQDGTKVVYTGDTNKLDDFRSLLNNVEFYIDVSMAYGGVHLLWKDIKDDLIDFSKDNDIYLMHIDNMEMALEAIKDINISIAPVF